MASKQSKHAQEHRALCLEVDPETKKTRLGKCSDFNRFQRWPQLADPHADFLTQGKHEHSMRFAKRSEVHPYCRHS